MKNKIAIIIAAALFKCARYLVKKKTEMCKNELQGIRIQRSTREEQKTDVLSAIYKKDLKDLILWVANEEGRN